jgi:hypothetical protein
MFAEVDDLKSNDLDPLEAAVDPFVFKSTYQVPVPNGVKPFPASGSKYSDQLRVVV